MDTENKQILIVEDEPAHIEAIIRAFESLYPSYELRYATTLKEYQSILDSYHPTAVLMDLNLPDGKAFDVLKRGSKEALFPILIMTSFGNESIAVEAIKAGAMDYVVKSPDAFLEMPRIVHRIMTEWDLLQSKKSAEEELRKYKVQLEELVEQRTGELQRKTSLLESINDVVLEAISIKTEVETCHLFLQVAEELSQSKFSFFGVLNDDGLYDAIAISNSGWDECNIAAQSKERVIRNVPLRGIAWATMLEGSSRIVNGAEAIRSHPDHVPIPEGHPPLTALLVVPLKEGDENIGMLSLANKEGGYTTEDQENMDALAVAMAQVLIHKRSEGQISGLNEDLIIRSKEIERKSRLLEAMNKSMLEALSSDTEEELGKKFLSIAEELTDSEFGLFGEINQDGLFDTIAISNPGWDECDIDAKSAQDSLKGMPITGVDRGTMREGKSRIVNSEEGFLSHPDHVSLPDGHPPLHSFLGVPLKREGNVIGMVGLGNKDGGYTLEDQDAIETLADTMVQMLYHKRALDTILSLNISLREKTDDLEYANRELEAFSSAISHDLRAPLRGISGFSEIVLKENSSKLDVRSRRYLEKVSIESIRMGDMINSLLDLSRVSTSIIRKAHVNLSAMAGKAVEILQGMEPARNVKIRITKGLSTSGDPLLLRQVLENLLGNSWKFTKHKTDAKIDLSSEMLDGEEVFFVKDNGTGFNMEYATNVFAPFQRLHTQEEFSGTGIGLSTVDRIIRRHGGRIWFESAVDEGATFYFTFGASSNGNNE